MKLFTGAGVLLLGVAAGWYLRGWSGAYLAQNTQAVRVSKNADAVLEQTPLRDSNSPPSSVTASPTVHAVANEGTVQASIPSKDSLSQVEAAVAEFQRLIDEETFERAVLHFRKYASSSLNYAPLMRSILRNTLQTYTINQDSTRFLALTDAWLSSYYSDTEILLMVTQYHRKRGQLGEALGVFQLATAYAYEGAERLTVGEALGDFVAEVDQDFSDTSDWWALQNFYEMLRSIGLEKARDELRLAEMYLANGRESEGREIVNRLVYEAQTQTKAEGILAKLNRGQAYKPLVNRKQEFDTRIAMKRYGQHYLLPLASSYGEQVTLILDTGASTTLITEKAFERFAARSSYLGPRVFNTANGLSRGRAYRVEMVKLGSYTLRSLEITVADNDFGPEVDGLLGMNILEQFVFQIDQDKSELKLNRRIAR